MTEKIFDTIAQNVAVARSDLANAPVRAELTKRLESRITENDGHYEQQFRVTGEDFVAPEGQDLVLADMVLPLVEDVPVFAWRCVQALRPGGLFLASTLGLESFREFRAAWAEVEERGGHVIPLTDVRECGGLLQKLRLERPVVDRDILTVTFGDFAALYASLQVHGVKNVDRRRAKGLTTPRKLRAMEEAYVRMNPREDGRIPLTVEVIYMQGFKPDSVNEALGKGSGKASLVRILDGGEG